MKLRSLSGQEYSIQPKDYRVYKNDTQKKSSLHIIARELIKQLYPLDIILEEVPARLYKSKILYVDFYLPTRQLVIEVNGEQHYTKNSHFHKDDTHFEKCINNDTLKRSWAEDNNLRFIELPFNKISEWRNLIVK